MLFAYLVETGMQVLSLTEQRHLFERKTTEELHNVNQFTALEAIEDLIYVGANSGSIFVFESTTGLFVKEIPF